MPFNVESKILLASYNEDFIVYNYGGSLTHTLLENNVIEQSSLISIKEDEDDLDLFTITDSIINRVFSDLNLDAKISHIYRKIGSSEGKNNSFQLLDIFINGNNEEIDDVIRSRVVNHIMPIFRKPFQFSVKGILLESICFDKTVWRVEESTVSTFQSIIKRKNIKFESSPKFDIFGLESFIKQLKIRDAFDSLGIKEASIIDKNNIGIINNKDSFSLCRIDKDYIKEFTPTEQTLYTFIGILSGKMNAKKADEDD